MGQRIHRRLDRLQIVSVSSLRDQSTNADSSLEDNMEDTMELIHGALDKLVACELGARFAWVRLHFGNMHIEGIRSLSACY